MNVSDAYDINVDIDAEERPTKIEQIAETHGSTPEAIVAWALRKLGEAQEAAASVDRRADAEIETANRYREAAKRQPEHEAEFFDAILCDYAERVMVPKDVKTDRYPTGKLTAHLSKSRAVVEDEVGFVQWAQLAGLDELVAVKESPKLNDLTKRCRPPHDHETVIDGEGFVRPDVALDWSEGWHPDDPLPFVHADSGELLPDDETADLRYLERHWAVIDLVVPVTADEAETRATVVFGVRWEAGTPQPKAVPELAVTDPA